MATDLDDVRQRIERARAETARLAADLNGASAAPSGDRLVIQPLSEVDPVAISWLWPRWLARGKLHLLGGHTGDGKGTLTAAFAAFGSVGGRWPDGTTAPRFRTLFVLGEDALDDTLRPRLDLHGADPTQVFAIKTVLDERGRERFFNVERHLDLLDAAITEYAIDLVVIDPLMTIMPGRDRNAEGDTRDSLTPLLRLGDRLGVAIIGIMHIGKPTGPGRTSVQKLLGATAFGALARVVMMTSKAEGEQMALGVAVSNIALKPKPLLWSRAEDAPICWHGASDKTIDEWLGSAPLDLPIDRAEGFLSELLQGGRQPSKHVARLGKAAGISWATLKRAADDIGIVKGKEAGKGGVWYWELPPGGVYRQRHADRLLTDDEDEDG